MSQPHNEEQLLYIAKDGSYGSANGMLLLRVSELGGDADEQLEKIIEEKGDLREFALSLYNHPSVKPVIHNIETTGFVLTTANVAKFGELLSVA